MAAAPRVLSSKLKALTRLRCEIFQTSYNPKNLRTGAKYLRGNLTGPAMATYYPKVISLSQIAREFPKMGIVDSKEAQRKQDVEDRKRRGKGTPKKAKTKADSRRQAKRR
ncbi:mitochondrial ribosomal subunit S27-domain-containing protein [Mycena alexandri]|uniref:Small ribosomal subunit protein mS33 n=1 Tax=Mycena alexandri TaxID=1745969 RepID=A0AAD6SZ29_9AGAR|nr:mitochondrial ribosomal subunit S27-domain-containing protein [Mycena alexandri]